MSNFFDNGGFFWWTGVVEDRNDPLQLGRCKVRVVGYHDSDKAVLPTDDLPWATVVQPITSAAMTGIGETPLGPVEGTWVLGFFADGKDSQEPMILGTLGGIPQSTYYNSIPATQGFQDPQKKYPVKSLLNEPDTNRLARGVKDPVVKEKDAGRSTGVVLARSQGTWDEPKSPFGANYPFNHVVSTESGHIQEFDDTPGSERVHSYHKAGTFTEVDRNGTRTTRIIGDEYEVLERHGFLYIKGKMNVTVDGSSNIYVKNNCNLQVDGNLATDVHGNHDLNVAGDMSVSTGGSIQMKSKAGIKIQGLTLDAKSDTSIHIEAGTTMGFKAKAAVYFETVANFAVKAVTAAMDAIFQQKNLTISPAAVATASGAKASVGTLTPPTVPAPVPKASPKEPTFTNLEFALSKEQKEAFKLEIFAAQQDANNKDLPPAGRETARIYASLKQHELDTGQTISRPTKPEEVPPPTEAPKDKMCDIGLKVVEAAKSDLGVLETGTPPGLNYGGKMGGGMLPVGQEGRIDYMNIKAGLDQRDKLRKTGTGYAWCTCAVAEWWRMAGLPVPEYPASLWYWVDWGKRKKCFSLTPKIGAAVIYGFPKTKPVEGGADWNDNGKIIHLHHIGIVSAIEPNGRIHTIEGNTSGGGIYTNNGCGVFAKTPDLSRVYCYILPPSCV